MDSSTIVAISDAHLGYRHRFSLQRLKDYKNAFEDAITKAKKLNPKLWIFGGDLLHHSRPDSLSLRYVVRNLMDIAKDAPVIVAIGNHETEGRLSTTYPLLYEDISKNIYVLSTNREKVEVEVGGKKIIVHGFEFIRNRKIAEDELKKIGERAKKIQEEERGKEDKAIQILLLHQALEYYLSPFEISISTLRSVAPFFDLILLGHVHKHQRIKEIWDITPAYYIGSSERISFNEAENTTGFMVFKNFKFDEPEFIPTNSSPMRVIHEKLGKLNPSSLNELIKRKIMENRDVKLLQLNVEVELEGNLLEVNKHWNPGDWGFTVLDVNITPKFEDKLIALKRFEINEEELREYLRKSGRFNEEELIETCVRLFQEYGGS